MQSIEHMAGTVHKQELGIRTNECAADDGMGGNAGRGRNTMDDLGRAWARTVGACAENAGEGVCVGRSGGATHAGEERESGWEV
jgi:hypothetical protein